MREQSLIFCIRAKGRTPGGYSLIFVLPLRVGYLRRFGLKTGIRFVDFGQGSGMVFEGTDAVDLNNFFVSALIYVIIT